MKEFIERIKSIEIDKWMHLLFCFALSTIICKIVTPFCHDAFLPPVMAFFATMIAGIGKETYDYYKKYFTWSWGDLLFDAIGALIGVILAAL